MLVFIYAIRASQVFLPEDYYSAEGKKEKNADPKAGYRDSMDCLLEQIHMRTK